MKRSEYRKETIYRSDGTVERVVETNITVEHSDLLPGADTGEVPWWEPPVRAVPPDRELASVTPIRPGEDPDAS